MEIENLQELLVDELRDIYSAENQLTKALPKMAKKATSPELREAFETHLEETQGQIERLDEIFDRLGKKAGGKTCQAMKGLLEEAKELMGEEMEDEAMDAALIAAAQKVEHYEIASYGTVRTWAKILKDGETMRALQETLDEEGATDKKLTKLAGTVNVQAANGGEGAVNGSRGNGSSRGSRAKAGAR